MSKQPILGGNSHPNTRESEEADSALARIKSAVTAYEAGLAAASRTIGITNEIFQAHKRRKNTEAEFRKLCQTAWEKTKSDFQSVYINPPEHVEGVELWQHLTGIVERDPDSIKDLFELREWAKAWIDWRDLRDRIENEKPFALLAPREDDAEYMFFDQGGVYEIRFAGESGAISADLKGAKIIFTLLQHPNKIFTAIELSGAIEKADSGNVDQKQNSDSLRKCHERLEQIRTDLESEKDLLIRKELEEERSKIIAEVRRLTGKNGKGRFKNPNDSARVSVFKAIKLVINNCREHYRLKRFADHLDKSINRGRCLAYRPEHPAPDWKF